MRVGVVLPQGFTGEFVDWSPQKAWRRILDVARAADALGFDSLWTWDHLEAEISPGSRRDTIAFEAWTVIAALAASTDRIRLGQLVICSGFRNPALLAKMAATLDVVSAGRLELAVGAGWNEPEYRAYGYRFLGTRDRLDVLRDHLEILTRMLAPGRSTYTGSHATVTDAINEPKGVQEPRIPLIVGGNGPNVTWRLAARYADELNLDGMTPERVAAALPVIRQRCSEIGRDPSSLAVSNHIWWKDFEVRGTPGADWLAAYRDLGLKRVMMFLPGLASSDEPLWRLKEECAAAGANVS